MIASWMFSATLLALLLAVAAMAAERALRLAGRSGRWPWAMALVAALTWPPLAGPVTRALHAWRAAPIVIDGNATSMAAIVARQLPSMAEVWDARLGAALIVLWVTVSAVLLVRLLLAAWSLRTIERQGRAQLMDGETVLVTESLGPAVVGVLSPRIAVPGWLMELDTPLRALVLRHEREHCRMRDPQLMWLSAFAVALMPWNAGIWWMSRRLRLALEIDCDARTLSSYASHESYGKLLLLIAQRQSGTRLVPMLAESSSHLTQRIKAMKRTPTSRPLLRVIVSGAVAAGAIVLACSPRLATDLTSPRAVARPSLTQSKSPGEVYFEFQVEKPVVGRDNGVFPAYPPDLKAAGIEGQVLAQYVVDTLGRPEPGTFKVLQSSRPEFVDAVRDALPNMRFAPAMVGDRPVKQLVQQPFQFSLKQTIVSQPRMVQGGQPATTSPSGTAPTGVIRRGSAPRSVLPNGSPSREVLPSGSLPSGSPPSGSPPSGSPPSGSPPSGSPPSGSPPSGSPPSGSPPSGAAPNTAPFQLRDAVKALPGNPAPRYPELLKSAGVEGTVVAQFVVDAQGIPEVASLKVLRSSSPLFTDAVKDVLPTLRYEPPMLNGRAVKRLIEVPFSFSLSSPPPAR